MTGNVETVKESPRNQAFKLSKLIDAPFDLYAHLPFRISVVSNLLLLNRDSLIRDISDLGPRELRVLVNIGSYMPIKAADIAYQARLDSYTISRAVKTLVEKDLISLEDAPNNRRIRYLKLNEKGLDVYRRVCSIMESRAAALNSVLSGAEQSELMRMLESVEKKTEEILAKNAIDTLKSGQTIAADQKELIRWYKKST